MRDQVKVFLKGFEKAYQKKDVNDVDIFMQKFFSKTDTHVLGTSTQEIYTSFDDIKTCIKNDWLYWGDLSFDYDQINISQYDDFIAINVFGQISYLFEDNKETDRRFVELMQSINQESDEHDLNHLIFQQNDMGYILDHFLHRRSDEKRIDHLPLSLTFFVKKEDDELKIMQLSYDVATYDTYPDVIVHEYTPYKKHLDSDLTKLMEKKQTLKISPFDVEVSDDFYMIDVDHKVYHDQKDLRQVLKRYDQVNILFDHSLMGQTESTISFMTIGTVSLDKDPLDLRVKLKQEISLIIDGELDDFEKLFKIRRKISLLNKVSALEKPLVLPIKCVGYMSKRQGKYQLEMIKFSYPMDLILEDKYI